MQPGGTALNPALTGALHRSHACTKAGDGVPVQVPVFNVHVDPTEATPDTDGGAVFTGPVDAVAMTGDVLVAPESAYPTELTPATCTVTYLPASADVVT